MSDTYTAVMDAQRAMFEADAVFQAALVKRYGVAAGDVRYSPGDQTASVRALGLAYQAKAEAWRKAASAWPSCSCT